MSTDPSVSPMLPPTLPVVKKKKKSKLWLILGIILGVLVLCGVISSLISSDNQDEQNDFPSSTNPTSQNSDGTKESSSTKPTKVKPTDIPTQTTNPNMIKSGTYMVGAEIKPGIYRGTEGSCYWERLKDLSGSFDSIIANGNSDGQFYVEISDTDYAFTTSCTVELYDPQLNKASDFPSSIMSGQYLVGFDIAPGLYKGSEQGCYWERQNSLSDGFNSIIANENTYGQFYVQVKETDYSLAISCNASLLDPVPEHSGDYPTVLEPGEYLVGADIQPGTYKGEEADCYWERLKDLSGGFNSIIANDNTKGQFYIQVAASDFAVKTSCRVERTGD